jgi:uncharacterized protein (TIGR02231 family)
VLATMSQSATTARGRIRAAQVKLRTLQAELTALDADLAKLATARKATFDVRIAVDVTQAVASAGVTLEYRVSDAEWNWIYEARLDTRSSELALVRQAAVEQGTGEDWRNVKLTLTTATPSDDVATPEIESLLVDLAEPQPALARRALRSREESVAAVPANAELNEVVVTGARVANVAATDFVVDYTVPGRISIDPDREPRLYPIADDKFKVALVARIVPSAERVAYLEATFPYERDVPLQGGELQLYRDGAFVGALDFGGLLPGDAGRVAFGVDERVQVKVRDEKAGSGRGGITGRTVIAETRQRIDVTSFHPNPIVVEVLDRVPVPQTKDIEIEVLREGTRPTQQDVDGKPGVWLWRFEAKPREAVSVRHHYAMRYPKGRLLTEAEGD